MKYSIKEFRRLLKEALDKVDSGEDVFVERKEMFGRGETKTYILKRVSDAGKDKTLG